MRKRTRILISGEGGQGVQLIAKALCVSAFESEFKTTYVPNYGVEQRGGVSLGFVQVSNQEIGFPKFQYADILVTLRERAVDRVLEYIGEDTLIIYDSDLVSRDKLTAIPNKKIAIQAYQTAKDVLVVKAFNMMVLGMLASMVKIEQETVIKTISAMLVEKYVLHPEMKHFNERAVGMGYAQAEEAMKVKA